MWSVETYKITATLKHEFGVWSVAFSPDNKLLATADMNGVARIWRLADQELLQTIEIEESNSVDSIAWTSDGKILAVASDGTIRFWGLPGSIETSSDDAQDKGGKSQNLERDAETVSDSDGGFTLKTPDDTSTRVSPDASTDAQTPAAKAVFGDVTPLTVAEAKSIFDASQFPAAGGTVASDPSRPTFATFSIHDEFQRVVDESVKTIKDLNWKVIARDDSSENRVMLYYILNQHLFICSSIHQESKSRTRMDVTVLGNVDIRSIPKMEVNEVLYDYLDYVVYRTTANLEEVIANYDRLLTESGWQQFRQFDGIDDHSKDRRSAMYRYNGVELRVSADVRDGNVFASLSCEMLEQDVPTPGGATEIELDDSGFRQRFRSTRTVSQLVNFFTSEMKRVGWTMPFGKQFEESKAGMLFTPPDGDTVYLELLHRDDGTTIAYMAQPTLEVSQAVDDKFQVEYRNSLPLGKTQMHSVDYMSIPFHEPLEEGSGRTIPLSVFFNTKSSFDEGFDFYR